MKRTLFLAATALVCALAPLHSADAQVFAGAAAPAQATVQISLRNGSVVQGTVVSDVPGQPLVLSINGQSYQVPRGDIVSMVQIGGTAPVAVAPSPVQTTPAAYPYASATPQVGGGMRLTLDVRGLYVVDPSWTPAIAQLVGERNATYRKSRKSLVMPILMMGVGVLGFAVTAGVTTSLATECVDDRILDCGSIHIGRIVGFAFSSALLGFGGLFLALRIVSRGRAQRRLTEIDQQLTQYGMTASLDPIRGGMLSRFGLSF